MQFSEQHNLNRQQLYMCFCFLHLASYFWGRIGSSKWINFTTVAGDAYPNSWDLMGGPRCSQSKHASAQLIFCLVGQMRIISAGVGLAGSGKDTGFCMKFAKQNATLSHLARAQRFGKREPIFCWRKILEERDPVATETQRFTALGGAPQLLVSSFDPMLECTESTGV